jgi:hypothetical protein
MGHLKISAALEPLQEVLGLGEGDGAGFLAREGRKPYHQIQIWRRSVNHPKSAPER